MCFSVTGQCKLPAAGNTTLCATHLAYQQCRQCGLRLRDGLFHEDTKHRICNACHHRRVKWHQSGRGITSVNNTFITEEIPIPPSVPDPLAYLESIKSTLADSLRNSLSIQQHIKWYPLATISFNKAVGEDTATIDGYFAAPAKILLQETDIDAQIEESLQVLLETAQNFAANGSDYVMENLQCLKLFTCTYNPVGGSSFIATPPFLLAKKCIINVQNTDDERCFEYSILAKLHPDKNNKCKSCTY